MCSDPRFVILETSGRAGQVALARGGALLGVRRLDEARRHGRDLAPALAALLAEQGWRPRDLHGVIVSRGPGSYTGLRVGVMSAKTFAYATGCALLAVDTFAAIALQAPEAVERLDVLADAQQDRIYVQPFAWTAGPRPVEPPPTCRPADRSDRPWGRSADSGWRPLAGLAVRRFADWLAEREAGAWVSGPGLTKWGPRLPEGVPAVEAGRWEPQPASLLRLGLARYEAGERDDPQALEPLYLRPSSAEEQWRGRG